MPIGKASPLHAFQSPDIKATDSVLFVMLVISTLAGMPLEDK